MLAQPPDLLGWSSSAVLVVTIAYQVFRQWRSGESGGVSPWLFVGQIAASIGFVVYSVLIENWVFIVTNSLLLLSAAVGLMLVVRQRRRNARPASPDSVAERRQPPRSAPSVSAP